MEPRQPIFQAIQARDIDQLIITNPQIPILLAELKAQEDTKITSLMSRLHFVKRMSTHW